MTSIELRDVCVAGAGDTRLLDDVSLTVPEGSTLAITGPPGAGKSTLLRVLVGLTEHTSGDVLLDDVVVNESGPRARDLAMVFQDYALHPHLDVFDNLAFSSTLRRGYSKSDVADRVQEVAEFLAIDDLLDLRPGDLDDSQRQRVALGRSLAREAAAYLFDSPFSAQAARARPQVRAVTTQWQREHDRTSIFTTSDVAEALTFGDRVAVMHQGFVHQVGTPRELYESPQDMFVAGFLGSPPMNLVPAVPNGGQLEMALATMSVGDELKARIGARELVVVGIRPEDCHDAESAVAATLTDPLEIEGRVDDVEWRGSAQLAYLGHDIDPDTVKILDEVEDLLEFDLFQSFLVAELPAAGALQPGAPIRLVVARERIHVFDPVTGENLTLPGD